MWGMSRWNEGLEALQVGHPFRSFTPPQCKVRKMMRKPRIQIPDQTQVKAACGYVRCSTDEQGSTSIPQQRREIEGWASQRGYKIVDWFVDEGVSGTNFEKRPGFQQMRQDADTRRAKFQTVIVYDESRWGRAINLRENSFWKMYFTRLGVQVQLIHTNSQHGNTIGSCVVEMVESAEASEYSRKLSRSILRGMLAIEQGGYSRGGTLVQGSGESFVMECDRALSKKRLHGRWEIPWKSQR
jgi:DNA invertase Pin-like site-specific DNA recombinase